MGANGFPSSQNPASQESSRDGNCAFGDILLTCEFRESIRDSRSVEVVETVSGHARPVRLATHPITNLKSLTALISSKSLSSVTRVSRKLMQTAAMIRSDELFIL